MSGTQQARIGEVAGVPPHRRAVAPQKPSAARERLLASADELFYEKGLHAVGVEQIIARADVTRVTFYRHFASKDELIEAYLSRRADRARERIFPEGETGISPRDILDRIARTLIDDAEDGVYRGCEFVNAAAEFSDTGHPARSLGAAQRAWLVDVATEALRDLGAPDPRRSARQLLMLRSGATVVFGLDSPRDGSELFLEAWNGLVEAALR